VPTVFIIEGFRARRIALAQARKDLQLGRLQRLDLDRQRV
jgi:hypothetical protein